MVSSGKTCAFQTITPVMFCFIMLWENFRITEKVIGVMFKAEMANFQKFLPTAPSLLVLKSDLIPKSMKFSMIPTKSLLQ
jgi:hypothetical protein